MNMVKTSVFLLMSAAVAGCYSHRSVVRMGQISAVGDESVVFPVQVTDVSISTEGTSDADASVKRLLEAKRSTFTAECNRALGDLRGEAADYISVDMKLKPIETDYRWFNFLLYMCTFGVIPTQIDTDTSGELALRRVDGGVVSRIPFTSVHSGTVSCFSPFALLRNYDADPQAICEERNKTALFVKTDGRYTMSELHIETMREGIGAIVAEWQKTLQAKTAKQQMDRPSSASLSLSPAETERKKNLDSLLKAGVITEEEFAAEVKKLDGAVK